MAFCLSTCIMLATSLSQLAFCDAPKNQSALAQKPFSFHYNHNFRMLCMSVPDADVVDAREMLLFICE